MDFSFSGIKTAFLYLLRDEVKKSKTFIEDNIHDISASLQHSLIQMLMSRLVRASEKFDIKEIAIAGGVSANSGLRMVLEDQRTVRNWKVHIPEFQYCTDNAGMIAIAAHYKFLANEFVPYNTNPDPRMKL